MAAAAAALGRVRESKMLSGKVLLLFGARAKAALELGRPGFPPAVARKSRARFYAAWYIRARKGAAQMGMGTFLRLGS